MDPIRTGPVDFGSNSTTVDIFTPMTGVISTCEAKEVMIAIWLSGLTRTKVRPGIRFSDDGTTWDAPQLMAVGTTYVSTVGWNFIATWYTLASIPSTTHRLFCQLGVWAANTSGALTEGGVADMVIRSKPVEANTLTAGPIRTFGNATTAIFFPVTAPIPAEEALEIRGTIEMNGTTGAKAQCGWQQADEPTVPSDWSAATAFGTEATANGIQYGTTFAAPASVTKRFLRFGVMCRNTSGTPEQTCNATIRIDYRN